MHLIVFLHIRAHLNALYMTNIATVLNYILKHEKMIMPQFKDAKPSSTVQVFLSCQVASMPGQVFEPNNFCN